MLWLNEFLCQPESNIYCGMQNVTNDLDLGREIISDGRSEEGQPSDTKDTYGPSCKWRRAGQW